MKYIALIFILFLFSCKTKEMIIIDDSSSYPMMEAKGGNSDNENSKTDTPKSENPVYVVSEEEIKISESNVIISEMQVANNIGLLTYNIDTLFIIGEISRVEARIKKVNDTTSNTIYNSVEMFYEGRDGLISSEIIPIGDVMNIELITLDGDAFTITEISSDNQRITENVSKWIWGVKANKVGSYNLILKVTIKNNGVNSDRIVFDEIIDIKNKPKTSYSYKLSVPQHLLRYSDNYIHLSVFESDTDTAFLFNGDGIVKLNIEHEELFDITLLSDNFAITNNRTHFEYKWNVKSLSKIDTLAFNIIIDSKNDIQKILEGEIEIDNNFKYSFNNFITVTIKKWYYLLSTILIPIGLWIRKKIKKTN